MHNIVSVMISYNCLYKCKFKCPGEAIYHHSILDYAKHINVATNKALYHERYRLLLLIKSIFTWGNLTGFRRCGCGR